MNFLKAMQLALTICNVVANILLGCGYSFKVIIDGGNGRNSQENKKTFVMCNRGLFL